MSKNSKGYVIGRSDTKEMICLGTFNKKLADLYDVDELVFLSINDDGTVQELLEMNADDATSLVKMEQNKAIIAAKIGSYWLTPHKFQEWAKKVFKHNA